MIDYIVKRLRYGCNLQRRDGEQAAKCIKELEAKIAAAKYFLEMCPAYSDADCRTLIKKALAELKISLDNLNESAYTTITETKGTTR